jgi:hypothetical protein
MENAVYLNVKVFDVLREVRRWVMFVRGHVESHAQWELMKWLALFALAGAIALAAVGTAGGAGSMEWLEACVRSVM